MDSDENQDAEKAFDVKIWLDDGTQIVRRGLDDQTASAYEDLITAPKVAVVEVTQTADDDE
ncbi:MAG: hypothetical protein ACJ786_30300 [Catenulispora sp.]